MTYLDNWLGSPLFDRTPQAPKFLPRGRALAREFGTIFNDIDAATAIFTLNARLCPAQLSYHGLLACGIMLLLRGKSTCPG